MLANKLIVQGNATATSSNIAASETLFRAGIARELLSEILFIGVALALYDLLNGVRNHHVCDLPVEPPSNSHDVDNDA
jgi:hypothetical protein